jgi:hypothetical protein
MIKTQFMIIGILSLIAVVGTTSTLSHAYAATVKPSDVLTLADKASKGGLTTSDINNFATQNKPDLGSQSLKDFADSLASGIDTNSLLGSSSPPSSTSSFSP